jgi:hemerythrin
MALVKWDQSYSVKVKSCDDDHKKLFDMINTLHDAMRAGHGNEKIQGIVTELANYTKYHFGREEALFSRTNYPDATAHHGEHQAFINKVADFQKDLAAGKGGQSIAVAQFLNDWLVHHIKQSDQKYSPHLNANGVS